jgi:hypothetical protein
MLGLPPRDLTQDDTLARPGRRQQRAVTRRSERRTPTADPTVERPEPPARSPSRRPPGACRCARTSGTRRPAAAGGRRRQREGSRPRRRCPWAIRPEALEALLAIAAREDISQESSPPRCTDGSGGGRRPVGKPLDAPAKTGHVRDGVAIIPIEGPIVRYANLFSRSAARPRPRRSPQDLTTALDDPAVQAILLEIDSARRRGGRHLRARRPPPRRPKQKPITAYVDRPRRLGRLLAGVGADRIVVAETAALGSIGVVMAVRDPIEEVEGDRVRLQPVAQQAADLATESGKAQYQATVDALGDVFVGDVARYRGVPAPRPSPRTSGRAASSSASRRSTPGWPTASAVSSRPSAISRSQSRRRPRFGPPATHAAGRAGKEGRHGDARQVFRLARWDRGREHRRHAPTGRRQPS